MDSALIAAAWPGVGAAAIVMLAFWLIAKAVGPKTGKDTDNG